MTLSLPVRAAVLEVVRRLRNPMRSVDTYSIGFLVCDLCCPSVNETQPIDAQAHRLLAPLRELRAALGLIQETSTIARWARGKSREEVAKALERVATPEAEAR